MKNLVGKRWGELQEKEREMLLKKSKYSRWKNRK